MDQFWEDLIEEKRDEIMDMEEEAVRISFGGVRNELQWMAKL